MSNHSQTQKVIDTIHELQQTNDYFRIMINVADVMVKKLLCFVLLNNTLPENVEQILQNFAIDSTSEALTIPKTLKGNLDFFQKKIKQDLRPILLSPYLGFKDFCYTLLGCSVNSIATLAILAIYLAIFGAIETIIIALLALSVVGLIVASPFSPELRKLMTKDNVGIFGRAALIILSIFPALVPFTTVAVLIFVQLSVASVFTRAGATIHSLISEDSSPSPAPL